MALRDLGPPPHVGMHLSSFTPHARASPRMLAASELRVVARKQHYCVTHATVDAKHAVQMECEDRGSQSDACVRVRVWVGACVCVHARAI